MAWHMFAGRPPFTGDTAMAVAIKHLNEKPPSLGDFREDLPAPLRDFVKRMIQKKKEDRHPDFAAVLTDIKQLIRQISGKEDSTVPLVVAPPRKLRLIDRPFRSQVGWLIGVCLLVMAASGSVGWTMRTRDLTTIESKGIPNVRAMATADGQLYWAATNPQDEGAWISVETYAGASDEMKARARTALALIYLKTSRRPLATTTFNDLVADPKFKANGFAGFTAFSPGLNKDHEGARKLIAQVDALKKSSCFPKSTGLSRNFINGLTRPIEWIEELLYEGWRGRGRCFAVKSPLLIFAHDPARSLRTPAPIARSLRTLAPHDLLRARLAPAVRLLDTRWNRERTQMTETIQEYDVVVIGTGPGGEGAAMQAVKHGRSVAVIERETSVGGNCTHRGTIPSKTLRFAIFQMTEVNKNILFREHGGIARLTSCCRPIYAPGERKSVIEAQVQKYAEFGVFCDRNDIPIIRGRAKFLDAHTIEATQDDGSRTAVKAKYFVITTGSRPYRPADVDFNHPRVFDSDTILDVDFHVKSITIFGAGVIGCEYASMFRNLEIKVNLVNDA